MKAPRWLEVEESHDANGIYARVRVKWWALPLVLAWALKENFRAWWLGVAAVAALLVGGLSLADPMPSPSPDAAKGRRGLVGAGPGEQVFSGRKVFDGGVEVQGNLTATGSNVAVIGGSGQLFLNNSVGTKLVYSSSELQLTSSVAHARAGTSFELASLGPTSTSIVRANSGTSSTDVAVKVGTSVANGTVNASAKLLSVRTGIGGTEVEQAYVDGTGGFHNGKAAGYGKLLGASAGSNLIYIDDANGVKGYSSGYSFSLSGGNFTAITGGAGSARFDANAMMLQSGTDSSGTPGAATINKPRGISCIAIGASSVVITNSLATATSFVQLTPLSRDTTCKELAVTTRAAGSFTASCTANATAATCFAWEVGGLL